MRTPYSPTPSTAQRWLIGVMLLCVMPVTLLSGCRGLGDLTGPTPVDAPIRSVELSSTQVSLAEGTTVALQVTARDDRNNVVADRTVLWSSSDTAIARVSAAGLVTAVRSGMARISASVDGQSAVALLTVTARTVASVQVTPATPTLLAGGFLQLVARTLDVGGSELPGRPVFWSSSDTRIVVVNAFGLLTGLTSGVATVTATSEARSATVGVTVSSVPVASIRLTPSRDSLAVGQSTQLSATPLDSTGAPLTDLVTWTTSAPGVATVSSSGLVQAIAPGTATITASTGARTATAILVVQPRPVGAVIISPENTSIVVGQTVRLTVQITDANGNLLTGRPISFASSNAAIARVAGDGTVTAVAPGRATITVTSEGKTGTASITSLPSPVASLRLTPSTAALTVGGTVRIGAAALDAEGGVLGQRVVTWTSGAPSVLSVAADGTVSAVGPGTALVFASSEGRVAAATITVTAITAATVTVSPATSTLVAGDALDLNATYRDANGTVITGRPVQWSSTNSTVVVVSNTGRVRAVSPGSARIDATVDGVVGSSAFTVLPVPVSTVTLSLVSSLFVGQTTQPTAVLRDAAANVLIGRDISWTSSSPSVASVNASTGFIAAVAAGTTAISASSEGKSAQATLVVAIVPVSSVVVSLAAPSLLVGGTTQASAVLRDVNNVVLIGRIIVWSSSNASIAAVNAATGMVTAVAAGIANVIASSEGRSGQASIAIGVPPVASVSVSLASSSLVVGATTQGTAVTRDAANSVLTGRVVTWASTNTSVATVSGSGVVTAVAAGTSNIVATSEGQSGQTVLTVSATPVASVSVSLAASSLTTGQSTQGTAVTRDAANNVLTGRAIVWTSTNTSVATVNGSGVVTALASGTTNIVATSEGQSGQTVLTVSATPVASVSVSLAASSLTTGQSTQGTAVTRDAANNVLTGRAIVWSSTNSVVATVNGSGVVTALASGTTNIVATSEGQSGQAALTVTAVPVATVSVSLAASSLVVGGTTQGTAVTRDAANNVLTGRAIVWASTNTSVATVNGSGVVTAVAAGTANIVATSEGQSGQAALTVTTVPVASVSVSLASSSLVVGGTTQGTAVTRDAANNVLTGRAIAWTSTNTSVATVNGSGVVTALAAGTTNIVATSEGQSGQAALTVTTVPVASVSVSLGSSALTIGSTTQSTAVTRDAANNVLTGRAIMWSSTNSVVATVNGSGVVTALASGTTNIVATSEGQSGQAALTVTTVPVASVSVSLASSSLTISQTTQGTAVTRDAANNVLTGRAIVWASSNTSIANVDASTGLVTAIAAGTTNIVATSEGQSGQAPLTVTAVPVATVGVSLASSSLTIGQSTQGTAVTRDAANNVLTGRAIVWASTNTSVATVNGSGVVTAVAAGTANIVATSEGQSGQAALTVTTVPVASVSVSLASSSLVVGGTTQATAVTRDAANNVLTGRAIVWTSANSAVATVDATTGLVTAVAAGTTNIVATSEGQSGQAALTVTAVPVATVSVSLASSSLVVGGTTQGTAVTRDAANNVLTGRAIAWSSTNSVVATVNGSGVVTALAAGTTNIVATSEGQSGQAPLTVTALPVQSVMVTLSQAFLLPAATAQASAVTRDVNNNVVTGRTIVWSTSNPTVATVDPNSGVVTAIGAGFANIIATSEGKSGNATLVVRVPVATVAVTLGANSISIAATTPATAVARDANGNVLVGRTIVWSSSDTNIAVVSSTTGVVTGVALGSVTITATSEGRTGTAQLSVVP